MDSSKIQNTDQILPPNATDAESSHQKGIRDAVLRLSPFSRPILRRTVFGRFAFPFLFVISREARS